MKQNHQCLGNTEIQSELYSKNINAVTVKPKLSGEKSIKLGDEFLRFDSSLILHKEYSSFKSM